MTALGRRFYDVIAFDASWMAHIEALYEYRGLADWLVAGETARPSSGYPYADILTAWHAAYPLSSRRAAELVVDQTRQYYEGTWEIVAHAVFDARSLSQVTDSVADAAAEIALKAEWEQRAFHLALHGAAMFYDGVKDGILGISSRANFRAYK